MCVLKNIIWLFKIFSRTYYWIIFFQSMVCLLLSIQQNKATCIWKFVLHHLLHLRFHWRYRCILFGYQAIIFYFSLFNVSHKSFIILNLIEYLHILDFHRATTHLNVWTNVLLFSINIHTFWYKQHTKTFDGIEEETCFYTSLSPAL